MISARMVAAAVVVAGVSGLALAAPTVVFTDGPGNTQGGIFHAATSANGNFDTFCCEIGEGLSYGFTYEYTIGTDIIFNGDGTVNPLNQRTAFIYTKFTQGEIRNLLGKPALPDDKLADAVQLAIWKLEGLQDTNNADALTLLQIAFDAVQNGQWSGLGNVRVMNNWDPGHIGDPAHAKQDTLIIVPLPSAAGLASVGLLGLGFTGRRRK
ncbi:MAG: hypothetical protein IPJ41_15090 [Phycisphaerales bacterium]|nr:hypothetical protein [Phycisphaerales bacterium]